MVRKQDEPSVDCSGRLKTSYREFCLIDFFFKRIKSMLYSSLLAIPIISFLRPCPKIFPKLVGVLEAFLCAVFLLRNNGHQK